MKTLLLSALLVGGWAWGQTPQKSTNRAKPGLHAEYQLPCDDKEWCREDDGAVMPSGFTKPEPMDVPAIKEHHKEPSGFASCHGEEDGTWSCEKTFREWDTDTCSDKSRILLTDESGGKHCIKFPKERP